MKTIKKLKFEKKTLGEHDPIKHIVCAEINVLQAVLELIDELDDEGDIITQQLKARIKG